MEGLSIVGKSTQNIHALQKVTGKAQFASDLEVPRMLHAKVLRSEHPHALILNIDTSKAEKLPGVRAVITAEDTLKKPVETIWRGIPDKHPIALDKVRYIGEEIAAVAADDELTAEEAVKLIKVEYEELPAVFDPEEAMKPDAPKIHDVEHNIIPGIWRTDAEHGDVEKAFKDADYVFEDRFTTHYSHACNLETTVCIADYDSSGKLIFWENSVDPFRNKPLVAKALGISGTKIRVLQAFKAGGFGHYQMELSQYVITALLAKKSGRPVRFVNSRDEELTATRPRGPLITYLKTGVKKDGILTARSIRLVTALGGYVGFGHIMMATSLLPATGTYRCPNMKLQGVCVYTNTCPTGPSRSFGTKGPQFATESQLDIIADKLGIDPLEFRLKNITRAGDTTVVGQKITSCGLEEGLKKVAEHVDWEEKRKKTPNKGIGLACGMSHGDQREGRFAGSVAYVKVLEDGSIKINSGEFEWGQGSHTLLSMIVAEELDVPLELIEFPHLDTDVAPYTLGPFGSGRITPTAGQAVRLAAIDAKKKLFQFAANMLEANPEDLELADQKIFVKGSEGISVSLADVASKAKLGQKNPEEIIGKGTYDPPTDFINMKMLYGNYSQSYVFTAQAAEVSVDPETGQVTLLAHTAAVDLGKIINPMAAEGQVHGGVATEIGYSLFEKIQMKDGQVLNPSFTDYKFPTALDIPRTKAIFAETECPNGPYGAKGGGSFSGIAANPAIANAVYNAIGVRIKDLPITPEKILEALKHKK
jgi:putative selenate reductase molybdopterin-binding subunit